jgi:thymidylate synthase (FAD)
MIIVKPSFTLYNPKSRARVYGSLEAAGRLCYRSEPDPVTREDFIRRLIQKGHESVLEHESASAVIVTDRGVMAELTRHRLASFSVESTRYVKYNDIPVIMPPITDPSDSLKEKMNLTIFLASITYEVSLEENKPAELARGFLPTCLATTIRMTANMREWRHVMRLRTSPKAHPQMRELMLEGLTAVKSLYPVLCEDIGEDASAK